MQSLGEKIAYLLKRRRLTKYQLAQILNISETEVYEIIKGQREVSSNLLHHIARILRVDTDYLLCLDEVVNEYACILE